MLARLAFLILCSRAFRLVLIHVDRVGLEVARQFESSVV